MKNSRVELTTERKSLAEVKIQSDMFKGDALSQSLFVITMMPLNHIHAQAATNLLNRKKRLIT